MCSIKHVCYYAKNKSKNKKQILDHIPRQSGSVSTWHFKSLSWEVSSSRKGFSRGELLGEQTINSFCSQIIIQTIFSIIENQYFPIEASFLPPPLTVLVPPRVGDQCSGDVFVFPRRSTSSWLGFLANKGSSQ